MQYWQLIDKIVQQITLQTKDGNPDVAPLDIDVRKLIKQCVQLSRTRSLSLIGSEAYKSNCVAPV